MNNKQLYINVNGKKIAVTEEIYLTYHRSKRRDRYFERDLKIERAIRNKAGKVICYAPAREDSLDRLINEGCEFAVEQESVEDVVMHGFMVDTLYEVLDKLPDTERALIDALFFKNMTERQAAEIFGLSQMGINKRKVKILTKLKKFLEN